MSEANKAIARRFFEAAGDIDKSLELYADDAVYHTTEGDLGREALREYLSVYFNAFSDLGARVEDQIAEGDKVVSRVRGTGKHTGELQGIPASGKEIDIAGFVMVRISNGKIAEAWDLFDIMTMMQQIGVIPAQ